jgi:hypothetical protein
MADADHPRSDILDVHLSGRAGKKARHPCQGHEHGEHEASNVHGCVFQFTGEVLAGQGEMADRVDTDRGGLLSSETPDADVLQPCSLRRPARGARVCVGLAVVLELD